MSLKEALDAAHGHEHNEDGSEMTGEQKSSREENPSSNSGGSGNTLWFWIAISWAIIATFIALIFLQKTIKQKA